MRLRERGAPAVGPARPPKPPSLDAFYPVSPDMKMFAFVKGLAAIDSNGAGGGEAAAVGRDP